MQTKPQIADTLPGLQEAIHIFEGCIRGWNECNGEGRMRIDATDPLRADDDDGSGEFYEAVHVGPEDTNRYEIQTCW